MFMLGILERSLTMLSFILGLCPFFNLKDPFHVHFNVLKSNGVTAKWCHVPSTV